jgi:hypothetical protein
MRMRSSERNAQSDWRRKKLPVISLFRLLSPCSESGLDWRSIVQMISSQRVASNYP